MRFILEIYTPSGYVTTLEGSVHETGQPLYQTSELQLSLPSKYFIVVVTMHFYCIFKWSRKYANHVQEKFIVTVDGLEKLI